MKPVAAILLTWATPALAAAPAAGPATVKNPNFAAVAAHLDTDGTTYHVGTFEGALMELIDTVEPIVAASNEPKLAAMPGMARAGIQALGIDGATAYGYSSAELAPPAVGNGGIKTADGKLARLSRGRWSVRFSGKPSGVFELLGGAPAKSALASAIPADVDSAQVQSLSLGRSLPVARAVAKAVMGSAGEGLLQVGLTSTKSDSGIDVEALLAGLGDEVALFTKYTEEAGKVKNRVGVLLATKDESLFMAAKAYANRQNLEIEPVSRLPQGWRGVERRANGETTASGYLVQTPFFLLFATDREQVDAVAATLKSGKDIRTNPELARLAKSLPGGRLPDAWNGLSFASSRTAPMTARTLRELLALAPDERLKAAGEVALRKFAAITPYGSLAVRLNDDRGYTGARVGDANFLNSNDPSGLALVAGAGIAVAIAVPAFLRARENSRGQECQEYLSRIDGAKEQYALEFRLRGKASVTMEQLIHPGAGLTGYLNSFPECPSGGTYTVGRIGEEPKCSEGHGNGKFIPHILPR